MVSDPNEKRKNQKSKKDRVRRWLKENWGDGDVGKRIQNFQEEVSKRIL